MAAKTQAQKIKEAKMIAQYRQNEVKKMNQNRVGSISKPKSGGIVVSSAKGRTAAANSATSSAKTAGRAKNVQGKLNKAATPKGGSAIGAIAKRFNVTAREARDIARAVKNVGESAVAARGYTKEQGQKALRGSVKDLKKQVKETGRAAKSGVTGTRAAKLYYDIDTGAPEGVVKKRRPKYGKNDTGIPGGSFTRN